MLSTTELWRLIEDTARPRLQHGSPVAADVSLEDDAATAAAYMRNMVTPDAVEGRDSFERMFRCFSADGLSVMAASTSLSTDGNSSAGSGGYADYMFRFAAQRLYGVDLWGVPLQYKEGRNSDIAELDLSSFLTGSENSGSGGMDSASAVAGASARLKFGRAYGFRNIQSIMIKMRKGTCDWDFVEIMACPSGCNNGGGQLRNAVKETPTETRARVQAVEGRFHSQLQVRSPENSPLVQYIYGAVLLKQPLSAAALELLHTRFHAVPKLDILAPLATKW